MIVSLGHYRVGAAIDGWIDKLSDQQPPRRPI